MLSKSVPGSAIQKLWTKIRPLIRALWMGKISHQVAKSPLCSTHCFMTRIRAWTCFGHFVTMHLPSTTLYPQTRQIQCIPHFGPSLLQLRSNIQRAKPLFSVTLLGMSGITESNAGVHAIRQPSNQEKQLIDDVLCLYQLKPSHQAYSHYAENAVFHDPMSIARGLDSIKSQFNGMPKLFAKSITESMSVKEGSFNINIAWY
jgi:hypothetical protein